MLVPQEVLPATDQCRCEYLVLTIRLSSETPVGELAEGVEEMRGIEIPQEEQWRVAGPHNAPKD